MSIGTKRNKMFAGIDIGSNSLRMLIATVENNKIKEIHNSSRATTRLASNINVTGMLSPDSIDKSINALKEFQSILKEYDVKHVVAVATSAVREASNGDEFITQAKEIGIDIEVISGVKEARTMLQGVKAGINVDGTSLIFDPGGGSTEFIISDSDNNVLFAESFKLGVVKLSDTFDVKHSAKDNIEQCTQCIDEILKELQLPTKVDCVIATAGTATTLAAISMNMTEYDWKKINGYTLDINEITRILDMLVTLPYEDRRNVIGMDAGREDLIIPGILILLSVMRKGGYNKIMVSDFGLREGATIEAYKTSL